ncbi:cysteine dioxygenase [Oceanibacterium hippocampi]|uniref:Cysteine dioxygenase type I n=1 Tax=Oceanibacterium hippocampi TaxID=745714 RepID=A0A1Y5S4F4_9PROT|nr:cysteine dioxygenase [Oceanibacterium hippocampi]SLN29561.1 hypothetical protein OCH7691_01001 [Oceanibacterium hippocampi]
MERKAQRDAAIAETVGVIRRLLETEGVNRETLDAVKSELLVLAARRALFPKSDFPLPEDGSERGSRLYRLHEDPDRRYALYAQVATIGTRSPVHNHTTWAVIVGIEGQELNRFYERTADGAEQTGSGMVKAGAGVALLPDDLHSIHIDGDEGAFNFHMYGRAIEELREREYWSGKDNAWKIFPAHTDIRPA